VEDTMSGPGDLGLDEDGWRLVHVDAENRRWIDRRGDQRYPPAHGR
jgi:hypothetical protein